MLLPPKPQKLIHLAIWLVYQSPSIPRVNSAQSNEIISKMTSNKRARYDDDDDVIQNGELTSAAEGFFEALGMDNVPHGAKCSID